jgi:hypothetical protein
MIAYRLSAETWRRRSALLTRELLELVLSLEPTSMEGDGGGVCRRSVQKRSRDDMSGSPN